MKFAALALDYDGTIATDGVMSSAVRQAIGEVRQAGIAVLLVTGRRVSDLRTVVGDLSCFDVVVAENGAVLEFPSSGRHVLIGHPPPPEVLRELTQRQLTFHVGDSLIDLYGDLGPALLSALVVTDHT